MEPLALAAAFAVMAIATLIQGTVGVGFGMLAVPVVSLIHPDLAPVPQLLTVLPLTFAMAWRERRSMDLDGVGWIIAGRIPGLVIGLALLAVATRAALDLFIGSIVVLAVVVLASDVRVRRTRATKFMAGVGAGTTGLVASMGGPPLAMLYSRGEAAMIRSTLAAVFTIGVTMSVIVRFASGNVSGTDLAASAILFPAVVIGYVASLPLAGRLGSNTVRLGILSVSAVAGVALIARSILG